MSRGDYLGEFFPSGDYWVNSFQAATKSYVLKAQVSACFTAFHAITLVYGGTRIAWPARF
jgi:hypothetical protein